MGWIERGQGWMIGFKRFSAYCISPAVDYTRAELFRPGPETSNFPRPTPINSDVTINLQVETSCCCLIQLLAITSIHFSLSIPIEIRANV